MVDVHHYHEQQQQQIFAHPSLPTSLQLPTRIYTTTKSQLVSILSSVSPCSTDRVALLLLVDHWQTYHPHHSGILPLPPPPLPPVLFLFFLFLTNNIQKTALLETFMSLKRD